MERIVTRAQQLHSLYLDTQQSRQAEIHSLSGHFCNGDPFTEFYHRLRTIKEFHRRYPSAPIQSIAAEISMRDPEEEAEKLEAMFSGEEGCGKYLDLYMFHEMYVNLKGAKRIGYLQYLDEFHKCNTNVPRKLKNSPEYKRYSY